MIFLDISNTYLIKKMIHNQQYIKI